MKTIWKFPLNLGVTKHMLPRGAEVLHVAMQGDQLMAWFGVDSNVGETERVFQVFGTGHEIVGISPVYLGTTFHRAFVWHVYEQLIP